MESNKLKETDIKNHTCYYFDNIININHLDFDNILLDGKSYKDVLIYDVECKTPYGAKTLHIVFR